MPQATGAKISAIEFINILFGRNRTKGLIYFSSLPNDRNDPTERGERRLLTRDPEELERFIAKHDKPKRGLFFCVGTINGKRNKANVEEIPGVWADLDFKGVNHTLEEIRAALAKLKCLPSLVVRSGHGLHLYWLFGKGIHAQINAVRIENVLRALADHIGGDTQVCEIARLMRLPGTHNTKFDSWVEVVVEISTEAQYHLEELEEWLALAIGKPLLERRPVSGNDTPSTPGALPNAQHDNPFLAAAAQIGFKPPIDVNERLKAMTYQGAGDAGIHATQLSVSAALLSGGEPLEHVVAFLLDCTKGKAGRVGAGWDWRAEERDIRKMCETWLAKHPPQDHGQRDRTVVEDNENVVDIGTERAKRKPKQTPAERSTEAPFVVAAGVITALRSTHEDIMLAEGEIWLYRDGFWRIMAPVDEQRILVLIQEGFETLGYPAKAQHLNLAWMRLRQHPVLIRYDVPWADAGLIVCRNGVLRLDTGVFDRHHPANYARRHIGATYTPGAQCPRFVALLTSMFSDRPDAELAIALLQEWVGSALATSMLSREERRAMLLLGPSRTGKTELARIFSLLFGDPIASPSVMELGEKFGLQDLYGATAWVRDDAVNEGDRLDPQRFKTVITGEPINVARKGIVAVPGARFNIPVLLTANSLPRARESSEAISNRSIILTMTRIVDDEEAGAARKAIGAASSSLGAAIFDLEGAGILNWALVGLERLRKRGRYDIPESVAASIQQFKDDNNPVGQWAREAIEIASAYKVERRDLVRAYNGWELEMEGSEARSQGGRWLFPKLRPRFPAIKEYQSDSGARYFVGIRLTDVGLSAWESYGKASPRNGAGGFAAAKGDVNQVHIVGEPVSQKKTRF